MSRVYKPGIGSSLRYPTDVTLLCKLSHTGVTQSYSMVAIILEIKFVQYIKRLSGELINF